MTDGPTQEQYDVIWAENLNYEKEVRKLQDKLDKKSVMLDTVSDRNHTLTAIVRDAKTVASQMPDSVRVRQLRGILNRNV